METFIIRPCKSADLPAVLELMKELAEVAHGECAPDLATMTQVFEHMQNAPAFYLNLVAEVEGRVAGFMSLIFYKTVFHRGGTALINELVLGRTFRGRGIGTALIERAKKEALDRGLDELEVGTESSNTGALSFYRKCGFESEYVLLGLEF